MKKFLKKLHLWLSLPVGLIISIMCLTGAILVFQGQILEWLNPQAYYVEEVKENPMSIEELFDKAESQLPASVHLSSVTIPSQNNRNYMFGIEGQHHASVNIDPYTGQVRNQNEKGKVFFGTVLRLHRWLLFPMKRGEFSLGKFLTGLSTLLFFFILVSGIIIWIPKTAKLLKQRLSVKTSKGAYRFWYDTHLAGGIYGAILLIALCLTGLTWSFDWYRTGVYKIFGVEEVRGGHEFNAGGNAGHKGRPNNKKNEPGVRNPGNRKMRGVNNNEMHGINNESENYAVWDKVLQELKQQAPDYGEITISQGTAFVYHNNMTRTADSYTFDKTTGKITGIKYYKDTANRASKLRMWIYMIHVGKWGGIVTQILTFLAALTGASLPITGYYMYFKKLKLKRKKKKSNIITR